eukprot:405490-Rhodomonas_salina.4
MAAAALPALCWWTLSLLLPLRSNPLLPPTPSVPVVLSLHAFRILPSQSVSARVRPVRCDDSLFPILASSVVQAHTSITSVASSRRSCGGETGSRKQTTEPEAEEEDRRRDEEEGEAAHPQQDSTDEA